MRNTGLAGPAWGNGERRYAVGDRVLVHGALRTEGQRLHNGSVVTVTAVDRTGLRTIDQHGIPVVLPAGFVVGHRPDGSPNCSHAWARTIDGIQGGTWRQVHLLGTAALERFTGYTGQSRSRHATHTWNVTRLPEVDHGGVLADPRTPEREILDALRRQPDTGFAIHDAEGKVERLLAERGELRALLEDRPPDRRPALRQTELALASARKELYWANHRLDHARKRLEELGPLSQLRRQGRREKASTLDRIDTFTADVRKAEAKIAGCEEAVEELLPKLHERPQWDADHNWPDSRLRSIDAELADLSRPVHQSLASDTHLLRRAPGRDRPAWLDRVAEPAPPPLPGHGIDLGL